VRIYIEVQRNGSSGKETEEQRTALVSALEFLFGERSTDGLSVDEIMGGAPFGWVLCRIQIHEDAPTMRERVAARIETIQPLFDEQARVEHNRVMAARTGDPHHEEPPAYPAESLEWQEYCCEAGSVAFPGKCPHHGIDA
jgi:hypothetical protein